MATLLATGRRRPAIVALGLVLLMLGHGRAYAASPIKIASPRAHSTVAKLVTASVKIKSEVKKVGFMVDGVLMSASPSTTFSWDTTSVPNGTHTISALAYSASNQLLRTVSEAVRVTNKASATAVSFVSPTNGQTVSGSISVALSFSSPPSSSNPSSVWSTRLSVDGVAVAWGYNNLAWNTTTVANGSHSMRVDGYAYNSSTAIGTQTIGVNVKNGVVDPPPTPTPTPRPTVNPTPTAVPTPKPTPTAVPTVHPTATPTPTTTGCVTITSPTANSAVSGAVTIGTKDTCTGNWYEALAVDGAPAGAGVTGQVVFTSSNYPNGTHTILITSQSQNPGSVVLGSASEAVNLQNSVSNGTSTPTPVGTPVPPVGGHYSMLGPNASLPNVADCVNTVNASPIQENAPWNQNDGTGYNYNKPPGSVPSYFYTYAPAGSELPHADFAKVDGNYSGSTDDLIRITACKWGIDEDYIRASAWVEDGWHQDCAAAHGGTGCRVGGDLNWPSGDPSGLPITPITPNGVFTAMDGYGNPPSGHWDSWSMVQTKVYYDWMTWPMIQDSTSFGLDFRFAEMRGCMNGDELSYFTAQSPSQGTDYTNAVSRASSNPNGSSPVAGWTNLQYLAYGCIDTHMSGLWFNGAQTSYLNTYIPALNNAPWPGGLR